MKEPKRTVTYHCEKDGLSVESRTVNGEQWSRVVSTRAGRESALFVLNKLTLCQECRMRFE